jgi:hypothetical protein|tara:strand:- start:5485 stop:5994 length:510 start_codon:yes stop_codon:yes gene_type:complete
MKIPEIGNTNFKSQLKTIAKDTVNAKASAVLPPCMGFVADQANQDSPNFAPLTHIYNVINDLHKPKEFKALTKKNIKEYAESIGLELRKESKAFGLRKGSNKAPFDPEFYLAIEPTAEATPLEKFEKAIKSADNSGLSMDEMLEAVGKFYEVELEAFDPIQKLEAVVNG